MQMSLCKLARMRVARIRIAVKELRTTKKTSCTIRPTPTGKDRDLMANQLSTGASPAGLPTATGAHRNRGGGGRIWWAHFEFTRINIEPTILRKKIEDMQETGASIAGPTFALSRSRSTARSRPDR
jgi:hypothetical protein